MYWSVYLKWQKLISEESLHYLRLYSYIRESPLYEINSIMMSSQLLLFWSCWSSRPRNIRKISHMYQIAVRDMPHLDSYNSYSSIKLWISFLHKFSSSFLWNQKKFISSSFSLQYLYFLLYTDNFIIIMKVLFY